MRKIAAVITMLSLCGLVLASEALAQRGMMRWRGSGGWGMEGAYGRMYDLARVETISGEVEKVEQLTGMRGMSAGIHILVKTDKESLPVHLGHVWYIERLDIKIEPGDKVEVKGARITFQGKPALVAAEVKKGDDVLVLRDPTGFPAWGGWRRRLAGATFGSARGLRGRKRGGSGGEASSAPGAAVPAAAFEGVQDAPDLQQDLLVPPVVFLAAPAELLELPVVLLQTAILLLEVVEDPENFSSLFRLLLRELGDA
jgi:hypothetical protein